MVKNRIGALRREAGLNQKELGQKLGVGQTTVSAWETGKNEPDHESLHKMAQMFHVSLGYLAGYEEDVDGRRGLSESEHIALVEKAIHQQELRKIEAEAERIDQMEQGITDEEIEEWQEDALFDEWRQSGQYCFFETFKIDKYFERLPEEDRQIALKLIEVAFSKILFGSQAGNTRHK